MFKIKDVTNCKHYLFFQAAYAKDNGYLGVNVWPVDGDDVYGKCGTKQILLKYVHIGLGNLDSED